MIKFKTPALKKLTDWMKANGMAGGPGGKPSPSALAAKLDCEQSQASRWLRGDSRPDPVFRSLLSQLTGGEVAELDWLTTDELRELRNGQAKLGAA